MSLPLLFLMAARAGRVGRVGDGGGPREWLESLPPITRAWHPSGVIARKRPEGNISRLRGCGIAAWKRFFSEAQILAPHHSNRTLSVDIYIYIYI